MTKETKKPDPSCIVLSLTADKVVDALKAMQIASTLYVSTFGRDKFTEATDKRIEEFRRELLKAGIDV